MRVTIGTRGSALALWQARHVAAGLGALVPVADVAIVVIRTEGDRAAQAPLTAIGGRGVFVKEIEDALLAGAIDLAVHSLKDLPTATPPGLTIAAVLERADPRDALVSSRVTQVSDLVPGATVATGSPRRRSQLLHRVPALRFVEARGNVDTRLKKLADGGFDALVLACAGLTRLSIDAALWTPIPTDLCLPAPGQGAVAIETRADDERMRSLVSGLNHEATAAATVAERSFLEALGAGCLAPAGALAQIENGRLTLEAMVATPDGRTLRRDRVTGTPGDARALGLAIAEELLAAGPL